jgi:2-polyprenyl-3-methyl-5-hydroxy-6-metoxy-1,4-benzoquinol methylase
LKIGIEHSQFGRTAAVDPIEWHSRIASEFDARYRKSAAFKERLAVWTALIDTYGSASGTVLDAGCGSGVLAFAAAARCRSVLGIDGGTEMIRLCQAKQRQTQSTNIEFRELRLDQLTALGARQFDLILCSSVLEYVEDFWLTIDAFRTSLSSGGILMFSVPNMSSIFRKLERFCFLATGHPARFGLVRSVIPRRAVETGLVKRGFKIIETRYYSPTPVLSRLARGAKLAHLADNLVVIVCCAR